MGERTPPMVEREGEPAMVSDLQRRISRRWWAVIALGAAAILLSTMGGSAAAQELVPEGEGPRWNSEACLGCHDGSDESLTFPSGEQVSVAIDGAAFRETHQTARAGLGGDLSRSLGGGVQCVHCHTNIVQVPHPPVDAESAEVYSAGLATTCSQCHWRQYTIALDQAHALIDPAVRGEAPGCVDCHDPHAPTALAVSDPAMQATCRGCHTDSVGQELEAIHTLDPTVVERAEAPSLIWFYVLIVGAVMALVGLAWGLVAVYQWSRKRLAPTG